MILLKTYKTNNNDLNVSDAEPAQSTPLGKTLSKSQIHMHSTSHSRQSKAQYSIIYLLLISGILLFFMGAIFLMSDSFQKSTTGEYGSYVVESIMAKIESELMDLKVLSTAAEYANVSFDVPDLVGEQRYLVTGNGDTISIRTYGNPSLFESENVTFWNATLRGAVFSTKGGICLDYAALNNTVTFR